MKKIILFYIIAVGLINAGLQAAVEVVITEFKNDTNQPLVLRDEYDPAHAERTIAPHTSKYLKWRLHNSNAPAEFNQFNTFQQITIRNQHNAPDQWKWKLDASTKSYASNPNNLGLDAVLKSPGNPIMPASFKQYESSQPITNIYLSIPLHFIEVDGEMQPADPEELDVTATIE